MYEFHRKWKKNVLLKQVDKNETLRLKNYRAARICLNNKNKCDSLTLSFVNSLLLECRDVENNPKNQYTLSWWV